MDTVRAIVQKVVQQGRHGPYAIATCDTLTGSITFSLELTVWQEEDWPEEGNVVLLSKLRQKRAGWRAKAGRFTKPSDEQRERIITMEFLYPRSRQFPFDKTCSRIIQELEDRNWQVPGIEVEFDEYGSGEQKFRLVRSVKSKDYELHFGRKQRTLPGGQWNDTAAVTEIVIPQKKLCVHEDESGPTFYLYVGGDYERDREKFMNGSGVNSKLSGKPRLYLKYKGECNCRSSAGASFEAVGFLTATMASDAKALATIYHTHQEHRSPLLVHTNDMNREYDPKGNEPTVFNTTDVMEEFRQYLEEEVLRKIMSHPIPSEKTDTFAATEAIPLPNCVGSLFCFSERCDVNRISQGQVDSSELEPANRYGLIGSGYRLIPLNVSDDGTVPEIAYDGFLWCGIGEVTAETSIDSLEVPGHYRWSDRERFVIRVKPDRANDIYIADHGAYEKRRKELRDAMKNKRDRFTDDEVSDFTRAGARTIIPISEYQGGFEQPVVLIKRELSFDEVEIVSGPHDRR